MVKRIGLVLKGVIFLGFYAGQHMGQTLSVTVFGRFFVLDSFFGDEQATEACGLVHRVYLPDVDAEERARRLVVLLVHGRAGNAGLMWIFSKAFRHLGAVVLAPQAPVLDELGDYSWWKVQQSSGEQSLAPHKTSLAEVGLAVDTLETFIDAATNYYKIGDGDVVAMGFSQGAVVASSLSLKNPALFKGVALLSGFLPKMIFSQEGRIKCFRDFEQKPRYFFGHGLKDEVVPIEKAEKARDSLAEMGADTEFHTDNVGHKVGSSSIKALRKWFDNFS